VGAAIAAGSHLENGIWALLVIAATVMKLASQKDSFELQKNIIFHCVLRAQAIDTKISTSPTRLVRAVIIPAAKDLGFW